MVDFNDLYALQQRLASPMLNIQVAQAQAPRPLGAPAPFNNAPTSTGLLLDQMNRFSDMRAAQAQQDIENENARRVQELQMMTFQAELAQQEQARQARENLAAQPGFDPMQQAMIRAGLEKEVAGAALRAPPSAQTDIGKANADLQAGRITRQQYNERVQAIKDARSSMQFGIDPTTGTTNVFDKNNMTLTQVTTGGQQRTIQLTPEQASIYSGEPVTPPPSTAPAATAQPTAPGEPDPFAVQDRARAIKALPNEVQKEFIAAESSVNRLPAVIERVRGNPDAFGPEMGATRYLGEGAQGSALTEVYADVARSRLTPAQDRARIEVFKEASAIINELAGAAVSGSEQKRIESFAPKETDTAEQIITKLNSALEESVRKQERISGSYGVPSIGQKTERPWKQVGGLRYRQVR